jgi:hypothetical protein
MGVTSYIWLGGEFKILGPLLSWAPLKNIFPENVDDGRGMSTPSSYGAVNYVQPWQNGHALGTRLQFRRF